MSLDFLLRTFHEEDKTEDKVSLTGILQRKRLKLGREKGPREVSTNFSPYNVGYGFCMREKVAQLAGYHSILIKRPTPKEQIMFDVGKQYHEMIQKYFWKCNMLEGTWRCHCCLVEWWGRSPKTCISCGSYYIEYREVPLEIPEYSLRGRADGILYLEVDKAEERHLVDIKTISNRDGQQNPSDPRLHFEDLDVQGPRSLHVVQLMIYQMMSGIHDGHLLYVGKNSHQMKSFQIQYNETVLAPHLDNILEALEWAKELKEGSRRDLPAPCSKKKCECEKIIRRR